MRSNNTTPITPLLVTSASVVFALSFFAVSILRRKSSRASPTRPSSNDAVINGGYQSLIGDTPLLYLPHISSLLNNNVKIYVKMECSNPGGTGKDRAARSMILCAEENGELPPPYTVSMNECTVGRTMANNITSTSNPADNDHSNIPDDIHAAIVTALSNTKTHGVLIEGTSGSTGISLASLACTRGHGIIVAMPDDQSNQKKEFLEKLGCGVVVVKNCSISNPGHYVNVARRIWEWLSVERRYDDYYWSKVVNPEGGDTLNGQNKSSPPRLIRAAFMNQFENLANVTSHYTSTGPEIYSQLDGKVDAFIMSAGTGGTLVGVGAYLKERWFESIQQKRMQSQSPPRIVLVDPPGSSLFNKIKFGVAYSSQQSEQKLRRHRYDTLAEGIGLDRITANFALGCETINWEKNAFAQRIKEASNDQHYQQISQDSSSSIFHSKIIDDALSISDQQAVHMAHYLLRHEGLFVGSSSAMNVAGALIVASQMPEGSNIVTCVCDGGQRHTSRFWNRDFVVNEWGLKWPGDNVTDPLEHDIMHHLGQKVQ